MLKYKHKTVFFFGLFLLLFGLAGCREMRDRLNFDITRPTPIGPNDVQATRIALAQAPTATYEVLQVTEAAAMRLTALAPTETPPRPPASTDLLMPIFQDAIVDGWQIAGSGSEVEESELVAIDTNSIRVQISESGGGVAMVGPLDTPYEVGEFEEIRFSLNGDVGGQLLSASLIFPDGGLSRPFELNRLRSDWSDITIPMDYFGDSSPFVGVIWKDAQGGLVSPFYIDEVFLVSVVEENNE